MTPASYSQNFDKAKEAEEVELRRIHERCRTSACTRVLRRLEFFMKITQQWLVSESEWAGARSASSAAETYVADDQQQQDRSPAMNNLLQVFPPSHFFTGLRKIGQLAAQGEENARGAKTIWEYFVAGSWFLVAFLVRNCILLKLAITAALLSRRDYLRGHIELDLSRNATLSPNRCCVLEEDIKFTGNNLARLNEHEKLTGWAQSLGVGFLSVPGLAALLTGLASGMPIMFLMSNMAYFRLRRVRVDHLCLIFDPLGERRRIKHELDVIVRELIGSLSNQGSSYNRDFRLPCARNNRQLVMVCGNGNGRLDRARFIQRLVLVNRLRLVKPYYVTSEWHTRFVHLIGRLIWVLLVATYIVMTFLFVCLVVQDLYETSRFRVAELACRRWNPNGTQRAMLDSKHLQPLDKGSLEDAYGSYDGSAMSLLRLALTVEAANYFSPKRMAFMLEVHIGCLIMCLWTCQSSLVYSSSLINRIAWLEQLEKEIADAAEESARRTADQKLADSEEDHLLQTLIVAYLHYEIFRRQEHSFQAFANCSMVRVSIMVVTGCSILYLMALNVKTLNRIVLNYLYCFLFSMINLFLLATSYKAKQVERIKRKVARIVARCAASRSLQMSYALELWRRQLRFEHIEQGLFGLHISYENVISLNVYTVAIFLLIIRITSHK